MIAELILLAQIVQSPPPPKSDPHPFSATTSGTNPKVLTCPKYQHEQKTAAHCANTCEPGATACTTECFYVAPTDECVDDMHVVTEKEWQELMERIDGLTNLLYRLEYWVAHNSPGKE